MSRVYGMTCVVVLVVVPVVVLVGILPTSAEEAEQSRDVIYHVSTGSPEE